MKSSTGSHTGTGTWLLQRASALVLALVLPALAIRMLVATPTDYADWQSLFAPLWLRVLLLLAGVALGLHAWVGMRDILMDYVHSTGLRLALYLAVIITLACSVMWLAAIMFGAARWSVA
jgi:succinate dehydrogenase / fumarate reductase membrane anchor subunit